MDKTCAVTFSSYYPVFDEGGLVFCWHAQGDYSIVTTRTARLLMVCLEVLERNRYGTNLVKYSYCRCEGSDTFYETLMPLSQQRMESFAQ